MQKPLFLHVQPPCGTVLLDPPLQTAGQHLLQGFDGLVSAVLAAILGRYLRRTDVHPPAQ